jgi:hypothetical protein
LKKLFIFFLFFLPFLADGQTDPLKEWSENKRKWGEAQIEKGSTEKHVSQFVDLFFPDQLIKISPTNAEMENAFATKKLFHHYFPVHEPSSYVGTFFEGGHPYVHSRLGTYQWNSMKDSGMDDHTLFRKVIKTLVKSGISSFRLAPLLHEKNNDKFLEKVRIIWEEGGTPIITIVWFSSFKPWEVKLPNGEVDFPKSYILNPAWPQDAGSFTEKLMAEVWKQAQKMEKKSGKKVTAIINGVNEPETLAGFNRHFWHGSFANWSHEENFRYYIISIIKIAEANVEIRRAVEKTSNGRRLLFMHNEAMTPDYYPSHGGKGKYAVSKLMLGDDIFLKADLNAWKTESLEKMKERLSKEVNNELEWCFKEFVFGTWNKTPQDQSIAREYLVTELSKLKEKHLALKEATGKSVKTDSVLYLDYYYQTEFLPRIPIPQLAQDLSSVDRLKEVLRARDGDAVFRILKDNFLKVDNDYAPFGPQGPILPFSAKNINDIDLKTALVQNDYLILERMIGLRREYTLETTNNTYKKRRLASGIGEDTKVIYRTDHFIEDLLKDKAKKFKKVLNVKDEAGLRKIVSFEASRKGIKLPENASLRDVLEYDGRSVFNAIFGLKREFFLGFEPQHYARQIRGGIRFGFYHFFMNYINALRLYTVGVGESGTPYYYYANLLHNQVMLEYVTALQSGVLGTQYVFGPAIDTVGWARSPLGHHWDEDHEVNPSGILKREGNELKFRGDDGLKAEWANDFMRSIFQNMKEK